MFTLILALALVALPPVEQDEECIALMNQMEEASNNEERYEYAKAARTCIDDLHNPTAQQAAYQEARALRLTDREEEALALYDRVIPKLDVSADSSLARRYHLNRGFVRYMTGRLSGAASDYSRALDLADSLPPVERADLASNAGNVYMRAGDMVMARRLFQKAESYFEEIDPDRTNYLERWADLLNRQADMHLQQNEPEKTLAALSDLIQFLDRLSGEPAFDILHQAGDAHRMLREHDQAEHFYSWYLDAAQENNEPHHVFYAYELLGQLFADQGDFELAEHHYQEAESRLSHARHDDYRRRLLLRMGTMYESQGDLSMAESYYERSIDIAEQYRASLRASDWADASFDRQIAAYHGLVRMYLRQDKPREAYEAMELARARHLHDLRMQSQLAQGLADEERQRFDAYTDELSSIRTALASDTLSDTKHLELSQRASQLSESRSQIAELPPFETPSVSEIQAALSEDQAVLSYAIQAVDSSSELQPKVFAITQDTLVARVLPADADLLTTLLEDAHPAFVHAERDFAAERSDFSVDALHRLHDVLIVPISDHLRPEMQLTIIPDSPLFRLPFSMLVTEEPHSSFFGDARYLIHDHPVSHLLASSLLTVPSDERSHDVQLSVFGQSEYDDRDSHLPGVGDVRLTNLPAVKQESTRLQELFSTSATFLNEDATRETFFTHAPGSRVLHVAAHAFASNDNAMIALGNGTSEHLLHLHELRERPLSADLVVLSSCNTAIGSISQTDGMLSLQHAFSAAGARSTLSTLWAADDEATSRLVVQFYENLREDMTKPEALRHAQLRFIDEAPPFATSPYFWAAPVLYGDSSPLVLANGGDRSPWIIGGGVLVLFLGIGFFVRRRYFP